MSRNHKKVPRWRARPTPAKEPKSDPRLGTGHLTVHWSFALFDRGSQWHDANYPEETFREVAAHMKGYEGKTWAEIERNRKHDHSVPQNRLIREAQKRLQQLHMNDVDELWRFAFASRLRIWGIREGRLFKVLWWDPQHKVCPSEMKYT